MEIKKIKMANKTQTPPAENKKVNWVVANYVNIMKDDWGKLLAKHGYSEIEEDFN